MKFNVEAKIQMKESDNGEKRYKIVANWDEDIVVEASSRSEAIVKFQEQLEKRGMNPDKVPFVYS